MDISFRNAAHGILLQNAVKISNETGYSVSVIEEQNYGKYLLMDDAQYFEFDSITLNHEGIAVGAINADGTTFTYDEKSYFITIEDDIMILNIGSGNSNTSSGTVIPPGNQVEVYSGGILVKQGTVLTGEVIEYGANDFMSVSSGGTANDTTVNSGAEMYISSGGVAHSTVLNSGTMYVASGGTANSTTVNSGYMAVNGGSAYDTIIRAQGSAGFSDEGYGSHLLISSGGNGYVGKDGSVYKTIVSSGGVFTVAGEMQYLDGFCYGDYGEGSNVTILNGGSADISGGYVWDLTVSSGGKVSLADFFEFNYTYAEGIYTEEELENMGYDEPDLFYYSGRIYNGEIHSGGTLTASGGSMIGEIVLGGTITLNAAASASEAQIYFDISERTASDGYILNNIAWLDDAASYSITVDVSQAYGTYKLAQGASGFDYNVALWDGSDDYGTLTVNGDSLSYDDKTYTLSESNGNLTLTIANSVTPGPDPDPDPEPDVEGGAVTIYVGNVIVEQADTITGAEITGDDQNLMTVHSGGVANETTVAGFGQIKVYAGGAVNDTTVDADGIMDVRCQIDGLTFFICGTAYKENKHN